MSVPSSAPGASARPELRYIHALRLLACVLVVVNHTHAELLRSGAPGSAAVFCLLFSLCKTAVTLFVMISGALLLGRDYDLKKIARMAGRALLLLLGVSILLAVW